MVLYTTLKENKQHGIDETDIVMYCDECFYLVASLFKDGEKYEDGDYTDFDKLYEDYTPRQVASTVLKYLRQEAKDKENFLLNDPPLKVFIELDADGEIAFDHLECLIEDGEITGSNTLNDIRDKARKKGRTIRKGEWYGENDIYFRYRTIDDLIDEYFPCQETLMIDEDGDEYMACTQCGNCH